jgi:ankyrin repeat protein
MEPPDTRPVEEMKTDVAETHGNHSDEGETEWAPSDAFIHDMEALNSPPSEKSRYTHPIPEGKFMTELWKAPTGNGPLAHSCIQTNPFLRVEYEDIPFTTTSPKYQTREKLCVGGTPSYHGKFQELKIPYGFAGMPPLLIAVINDNMFQAKELLESGELPDTARATDGVTPLLAAIELHHTEMMYLLLYHKADVNKGSADNFTPLHGAIAHCNAIIVRQLLQYGANANAITKSGVSPLIAVMECDVDDKKEMCTLLLKHGADPNKQEFKHGITPLYAAAQNGEVDCVKILLASGAKPNVVVDVGESPLVAAIRHGYCDVVTALLENKADPNFGAHLGMSPLHLAMSRESVVISQALIANGADLTAVAPNGKTAFMCAMDNPRLVSICYTMALHKDCPPLSMECKEYLLGIAFKDGSISLLKVLLKNGVDPNYINKCGDTLLTCAIKNGQTEMVCLLLEAGADPNRNSQNLIDAICDGHTDIVHALLIRGADANAHTSSQSALICACQSTKNTDMVKMLLEARADPNLKIGTTSPITAAIQLGNVEIVTMLLVAHAILPRDPDMSQLMVAVKRGDRHMIKLLLDYKEDPNSIVQGKSVLGIALEIGFNSISEMLLDRGADIKGISLPIAVANGANMSVIKKLLEKGIDPNQQDSLGPALIHAITFLRKELVELLLSFKANPNIIDDFALRDKGHVTPLRQAVTLGAPQFLEILFENGASLSEDTKLGCNTTLLQEAVMRGYDQPVEVLLKYNADPNSAPGDSDPPLVTAIRNRNTGMAKLLLAAHANPNASSRADGQFVLHMALAQNMQELITPLLDAGADPNIQSPLTGNTPLHLAVDNNSAFMVTELIKYGANPNIARWLDGLSPIGSAYKLYRTGLRDLMTDSAHRHTRISAPKQPEKTPASSHICIVCYREEVSQVCVPCHHACLCKKCYIQLPMHGDFPDCPMCRHAITSTIQIFFS